MGLIHQMLLLLEEMSVPVGSGVVLKRGVEEISIPGYGLDQIKFHFSLLRNAGFIDVVPIEPSTSLRFRGLTWTGHDFLDRARQSEARDYPDASAEMDPDLLPLSSFGLERRARAPFGAEAQRFYPRKSLRHRA
jgi:hypothetical protein